MKIGQDKSPSQAAKLRRRDELQVQQGGLEKQIEELRRALQELELSRNKYAALYDFAPVSYFVFDPVGIIREVNLASSLLLETERQGLVRKPFAQFIADAEGRETFHRHLSSVLQQQTMLRCEIRIATPGGIATYGQLQSVAVAGKTQANLILTSIVDVTVRRQLEEKLQLAHDRLEETVQERTAELTRMNLLLSQEIEERKKAETGLQGALDRNQADDRSAPAREHPAAAGDGPGGELRRDHRP